MKSNSLPMHQRRTNSGNSSTASASTTTSTSMYGRGGKGYKQAGGRDVEGGRFNDTNANILEQQNNDRISELSGQVARLKGLTIDIGNEVREQNSLLDQMGDGFVNTRDMLQGSLRRIGTMLESGGAKHMCYMVGFVVFVLVFLYWILTFKGQTGA
jgi:blocked-early-in-transport protein 1